MPRVYSVSAILSLTYIKRHAPLIHVLAIGRARSSGWTTARLEPRVYVTPPLDGMQDFDFVADSPTGETAAVLAPILAEGMIRKMRWMRGIRIHADFNVIERLFAPVAEPLFFHDLSQDRAPGEPLDAVDPPFARAAVQVADPHEEADGVITEEPVGEPPSRSTTGLRCYDHVVLGIGGWPEVKTEWELKCVLKTGGRCRIRTKVPVTYHRTSELKFIATVCLPTEEDVGEIVRDCVRDAVAAGVIGNLSTGSTAAAAASLVAFLRACLSAKGVEAADGVHVSIHERKVPGAWKRL